jgi:hypothetical protein
MPTTMGMTMKINAKHKRMNPKYEGAISEFGLPKSEVYGKFDIKGMCPVAVMAPKIPKHSPGQPHKRTVTMVAMIPPVFLFTFSPPNMFLC